MPSDEMVEKACAAFNDVLAYVKLPGDSIRDATLRVGMREALRAALAAADAGEPVAVGVKTDPPVVAIGSRYEPVYRYQTPDHRSFSQTAPPMPWQGDYTPVTIRAGTVASPPSEASRDEREKWREQYRECVAAINRATDREIDEAERLRVLDGIATAIRARGDT